jgi:hypothetical protein
MLLPELAAAALLCFQGLRNPLTLQMAAGSATTATPQLTGGLAAICSDTPTCTVRQLLAGKRPPTRRSARGVPERAVTDPERTLAL